MRHRLLALPVAALTLALAACGSSSSGSGNQSTSPAKSSASADLSRKPKVPRPSGPPPKELVSRDIVTGTGTVAKPGDDVTVQYVGVDYSTGKQFDASWDRGQPFTFQLGSGQTIPGWDKGVAGMRVGGRRELIIPPSLGYGAQGQPPVIKPNETLIFVIDLKRVQH